MQNKLYMAGYSRLPVANLSSVEFRGARGRAKKPGKTPLASIIIPSYNYAKYLPAAIKSALGQSYGNVEVIVADDGSADGSPAIAKRFPVKLLLLPHRGIAHAVNAGVGAAKGEYVAILGADDLLHPLFVEKCMAKARESPEAAFAYTQTVGFGAETFFFKSMPYDPKYLLKSWFIPATFLLEKSAFQKAGGYDPSLAMFEDFDFLLSLRERGFSGVLVPEPLFFYRQHASGSRGMSGALVQRKSLAMVRAKHRVLQSETCGMRDNIDIFAMDSGIFAFALLRGLLSSAGPGAWLALKGAARSCVAALLGKKAYSQEIPPESLRMIKKLDRQAEV